MDIAAGAVADTAPMGLKKYGWNNRKLSSFRKNGVNDHLFGIFQTNNKKFKTKLFGENIFHLRGDV